ncbi:Uma2 family endonuclease [Candidatus Cyanaurora vandensis]|uniref:Uma2 family endonuclease n=1 Tax=Candidatus Cyanaurora vandensis TaxID=2714958 RepID=UPI00257944CE|nr:Uma2 family endonuclease [Candidatus Cyanaurora vandensis]
MTQTKQQLTFEEYLSYDDGTDVRYELVDGELYAMTPAMGKHGTIAVFLLIQLYLEIQRRSLDWQVRLNDVGMRTAERRVRIPDLCVMTLEQAQAIENVAAILITPPLLIAEIISPESVRRDYRTKRTEYAALAIPEYWIVDPLEQKISILQLEEGFYDVCEFTGQERIVSPTFTELTLTADQILRGV